MAIAQYYNTISSQKIHGYLIGLPKLSISGIKMVMVFADASELTSSKTASGSNDGARNTTHKILL